MRDALREHLTKREVETAIYYPLGLHEQKCFAYLGYKKGDFPESRTRALAKRSRYPFILRFRVKRSDTWSIASRVCAKLFIRAESRKLV